jgi:hypothetical protein
MGTVLLLVKAKKLKVKLSHYRPGGALGVPRKLRPQNF